MEGDGSRGPRAAASGLLLVSFLRRAVASEMQVIRTRIHLWLIGGLLRWGGRRRFLAPPSLQKMALKGDAHSKTFKKN